MRSLLLACLFLLLSAAGQPASPGAPFSGRIVYENEYQTMAGEPLYYAVKPKNWFYVQGNNLKMYDRNKKLQELYLGEKNEFYRFDKGQPVLVTAADHPAAGAATLKCLPTTATILGYACQMLQLTQDGTAMLVFYSPELRVNLADFSRCPAPGWHRLLQATDGALPLRTISVDARHDVAATTEAIEVQALTLDATDFTTTAPAR